MSFDLAVFGSELPDLAGALQPEASALAVDGDVAAAQASVALRRQQRGHLEHLCTIDGPLEAEDDDAPAHVAEVLLACRWTVQISCPGDLSKAAFKIVERVARRLADSGRGVVYDPQLDEVVWPRNPRRLRELPRGTRDDVARIELEWLVSRRLTSGDAHALLRTLRRMCPEAVPVRFGDYEPMQGRLERDGDESFARMWDGTAMPFWSGRFPLDHGYVHLRRDWGSALDPEEREARTPTLGGRKAVEVDSVSLQFWTDVTDDGRWLSLLKRLFVLVARQLGCFFAAGYCSPNSDCETVSLMGRYWLGVPDADLWLVWAGTPYLPELPSDAGIAQEFQEGVLLELGTSPVAWEELARNRINWPARALRRGDHLEEYAAAPVIPDLTAPSPDSEGN